MGWKTHKKNMSISNFLAGLMGGQPVLLGDILVDYVWKSGPLLLNIVLILQSFQRVCFAIVTSDENVFEVCDCYVKLCSSWLKSQIRVECLLKLWKVAYFDVYLKVNIYIVIIMNNISIVIIYMMIFTTISKDNKKNTHTHSISQRFGGTYTQRDTQTLIRH